MDHEVQLLRSHCLARNTAAAYRSHLKSYLDFCTKYNLPPAPASPINIGRYIAYLARSKAYSTITQYINIIRILHLELGLSHPYQDNYHVQTILKGVKRLKGNSPSGKQVLTLNQLHSMAAFLDLACMRDLQIWCALLTCFHGLLHISSVTVPTKHAWDNDKILTKNDIRITTKGCTLNIRHSKTNQYKERIFEAVIPTVPDPLFCPTRNLITFQRRAGQLVLTDPALAFNTPGGNPVTLTPADVRAELRRLVKAIGFNPTCYSTHSLRRSGATYLFNKGIPVETIKILGDWKSDCVFTYLKPYTQDKLKLISTDKH